MIILYKDKILHSNDLNEEKEIDSMLPFLSDTIKTRQPFIFKDFMRLLFKEVDLYNYLFSYTLGGFPLEQYISETLSEEKTKDKKLYYLHVYRNIELYDDKDDIENDLTQYAGFGAIGAPYENNLMSYSVSMTHLSEISHLPIFVDDTCKLFKMQDNSFNFDYNSSFTVFEFVNSILYEISFYGDYDRKQKIIKDLESRLSDIKKDE